MSESRSDRSAEIHVLQKILLTLKSWWRVLGILELMLNTICPGNTKPRPRNLSTHLLSSANLIYFVIRGWFNHSASWRRHDDLSVKSEIKSQIIYVLNRHTTLRQNVGILRMFEIKALMFIFLFVQQTSSSALCGFMKIWMKVDKL